MRRVLSFLLIIFLFLSFCSCGESPSAHKLLGEICSALGAVGVIYSPEVEEGSDGYVSDRLFSSIFHFYGKAPKNYAILLNSRVDEPYELGIFVCESDIQLSAASDAVRERLHVLGNSEKAGVSVSGCILFYSFTDDPARATAAFSKIIRSRT